MNTVGEIRPRPEFVSALENRLLVLARQEVPAARTLAGVRVAPAVRKPRPLSRMNYRLGIVAVGLSAAMVVLFVLALLSRGSGPLAGNVLDSYLPSGKVHHLVIQHAFWSTRPSDTTPPAILTTTQDVWLGKENGRFVMYSALAPVPKAGYQGQIMWVTADAVYDYKYSIRGVRDTSTYSYIYRYPYNPSYPERYLPDPNTINDWSSQPQDRVVGRGTLDGRPVIEIATDPSTVPTPAAPDSRDKDSTVTVDHVWLDTQVFQMVRLDREVRVVRGPDSGSANIEHYRLLSDQELDRSSLAPDFFSFKVPVGVDVLDSTDPIGNPLITPTVP